MTGLADGKLHQIPIYFDFDEHAEHDKFWSTELDSVRNYYIELISYTGAYHFYNQYVMQDLAYDNKPLDLSITQNWSERRPSSIFLPYSQLLLTWDLFLGKWEYANVDESTLSTCSSMSCTSYSSHSSSSPPSLSDPIDEFEYQDQMRV